MIWDGSSPPASLERGAILRVSRRAMATTFEIALPAYFANGLAAAEAALDLVDDIEAQLTVYRDTSEVARINREAARTAVRIDESLFALLTTCAGLANDTNGAFDPASGAFVLAWNQARRLGRIPTGAELALARAHSGFRHLLLDADKSTVKFLRPGLLLNFGAVGKGYALDAAARRLRERWGVTSALLSAGGSSVLAIGVPPDEPRGWLATIRHPQDDRQSLGELYLSDQSLGTSAATFQYFEYEGRRYGHVLDPRTGTPASGTASASVVAPTATEADALSTAAFVRGLTWLQSICRDHADWGGLMLAETADAIPTVENLRAGRYQLTRERIEWRFRTDD